MLREGVYIFGVRSDVRYESTRDQTATQIPGKGAYGKSAEYSYFNCFETGARDKDVLPHESNHDGGA